MKHRGLMVCEPHTVHIQEARSRQKADRLSEVRTFGVVVSPEDVL